MRLDNSNKITLDCIFSYILVVIYKINLNKLINRINDRNITKYLRMRRSNNIGHE